MRATATCLEWEPKFLKALANGATVQAAAAEAGISPGTAQGYRRVNARFSDEWEKALKASGRKSRGRGFTRTIQWKKAFLEGLAETSNVRASARRVNVPLATIYKARREEPQFAAKWLAALHEGYDNLEMEVLGYLRDPAPKRKMDVTAALRLLAAHRETVERRRALAEEDDEQAVRESLDAFLEGLRQRRLANEAILIEATPRDVAE